MDPIDGSKGFAEGHLEHVTNLIGITVRGRPKIGILHKPFSKGSTRVGRTFVGSVESGLFFFDQASQDLSISGPTYVPPFTQQRVDKKTFKPSVISSLNKSSQSMMDEVMVDLHPRQVTKVAGAGNKFLHMTDERSDFYLNLVPSYKCWDVCASEAIFASRLGIMSDAKRKPLFYESSRKQHTFWNGLVAARNADIYEASSFQYQSNSGGKTLEDSQLLIRRECHLRRVSKLLTQTNDDAANAMADQTVLQQAL